MASLFPKKMKKGCYSCSILQTHKDVMTEIALHLSVQTLFRCRAVCKLWRDVIDSPYFRKLHISFIKDEKEEDDEMVYLQLNHDSYSDVESSIKMINKNLNIYEFKEGFDSRTSLLQVKGLICAYGHWASLQPMIICNPFLGQVKTLPKSPILANPDPPCDILPHRRVAIGCDGEEFYKVVELLDCSTHRRLHAHLYSRRTDSWRELGDLDEEMRLLVPINNKGRFAHWYTMTGPCVILTFDMKNEVFRTTILPDSERGVQMDCFEELRYRIVAKDEGFSFIRIIFPRRWEGYGLVRIYESSISTCEEEKGLRKLSWNHVANLEKPLLERSTHLPLWRRLCDAQ